MSKRFEKWLFTGIGTLAAAGVVLVVTHIAVAEIPPDATYKGSEKVCNLCHKVTSKELTEAFLKTAHPKALLAADKAGAIVADFTGAPVKKEDIQYALGVGRGKQAYIGKDGKLLPAYWNVKDKKWVEQPIEDAIKNCVPCHVVGYDSAKSTWVEAGVQCESCHGPGSAHATKPVADNIGQNKKLPPDRQAMICGQCHAQGTSTDGSRNYPVGYKWGDDLNKYFKLAEVTGKKPNQQYNEWHSSKHAKSDPVVGCTTCHEVHGAASSNKYMLKKAENELCGSCHADALAKPEHPKVTDAMKCSMCHMPEGMHTFKDLGK